MDRIAETSITGLLFLHHKGGAAGKDLSEALVKALNDPDAKVLPGSAACMISRFIEFPKPAIPVLAGLVRDDRETTVRRSAAQALLHAGPAAKSALSILKEARKDKDGSVAYAGADCSRIEDTDEEELCGSFCNSQRTRTKRSGGKRSACFPILVCGPCCAKDGLKDKNPRSCVDDCGYALRGKQSHRESEVSP